MLRVCIWEEQFQQIIRLEELEDVDWFPQVRSLVEPHSPNAWYHHPQYNPTWYHFASAIARETLERIGGFDERFANGYCFDDNNLIFRVRKMGLKMPLVDPNQGYVAHLWHPKNPALCGGCKLWEVNRRLHAKILEGALPLLDPNRVSLWTGAKKG